MKLTVPRVLRPTRPTVFRAVLLAVLLAPPACTPTGARDAAGTHEPHSQTDGDRGTSATGSPSQSLAPRPADAAGSSEASRQDRSEEGARLVASLGCTACHEMVDRRGDPLPPPSSGRDCYRCHRRVIAGDFDAEPAQLARWQAELPRQFDVPSLRGAGRFARTWLIDYLLEPHDIRPNLDSQMPRIPMTRDQAEAIADFLGARSAPETTDRASRQSGNGPSALAGDPTRGAAIFARSACTTCHAPGAQAGRPAILAPDLARATSRYSTANLTAWLLDPLAVKSDAVMPGYQFSQQEAADVVAHLATLEPPTQPAFAPPDSLLLDRPVRFPEVHAILRARCLHCHNRPSRKGPGGTGFSGGWGYPGKRLGLLTYADVKRGGETRTGRPRSLFERMPDGYSRLVSHLIARHKEYAGDHSDTVGMPLGQPPLSWERIQIIHTWVETGRRR